MMHVMHTKTKNSQLCLITFRKRKNDRKFYSANVMKIDSAQEIFNFANANNGSITAGYIELV